MIQYLLLKYVKHCKPREAFTGLTVLRSPPSHLITCQIIKQMLISENDNQD